jgi:hypothetical protein
VLTTYALRGLSPSFKQLSAEILVILRPGAVQICVVAHELLKVVQPGVEGI